jgi:hypothetical protein
LTVIALLAAYATGISLTCVIAPWDTTGCALVLGLLLLAWVPLRRSRWGWLPVTILLCLGGFIQASLALKAPVVHNHISRFADKPAAVIEGRVLTSEKRTNGGYRLLTDVQQVVKGRTAAKVTAGFCFTSKEENYRPAPGRLFDGGQDYGNHRVSATRVSSTILYISQRAKFTSPPFLIVLRI